LEVLRNSDDGGVKGSLLWLLDHTKTAMGKRLLKGWVSHPLRSVPLIQDRLDAVQELSEAEGKLDPPLAPLPPLPRCSQPQRCSDHIETAVGKWLLSQGCCPDPCATYPSSRIALILSGL